MKRLYYHKKRPVVLPERWEELTATQYIHLAELLHSKLSDDAKVLHALRILLKKSVFTFMLMNKDMVARMCEHACWVFEVPVATKQLITSYKSFYGPANDFDNLTLAEFHACEMAYYQFTKTRDEEHLTTLAAILFRKPKAGYDIKVNKDGDVREAYNANVCAYHEIVISDWKRAVKYAILMWYDACRQQLEKLYPLAFGKQKAATPYFDGLFGLIRSLSGDKYGTFEDVEGMYVHNAFMEIVASKREEAELSKS